jgi:hypothetical protein
MFHTCPFVIYEQVPLLRKKDVAGLSQLPDFLDLAFSASRTKLETSVNNEVCAPISADARQNLTLDGEQVSPPPP